MKEEMKKNTPDMPRPADAAFSNTEQTVKNLSIIPKGWVRRWHIAVLLVFFSGAAAAFTFINSTITGSRYVPQQRASAAPLMLPDLTAGEIGFEEGAEAPGGTAAFTAIVKNLGVTDASAFRTMFEIDYQAAAFESAEKAFFGTDVTVLKPGDSAAITTSPAELPKISGTHAVRACVDVFGQTEELDENNNCSPAYIYRAP